MKGAIFGVCSSLFVALYSIVVKKVMSLLDDNEYLLIEYNTPIAIILLIQGDMQRQSYFQRF